MNELRIVCPHCEKFSRLQVPERLVGKKVNLKCGNPGCGKEFSHVFSLKEEEDETTFLTVKSKPAVSNQLRITNEKGDLIKILNLNPINYLIGRDQNSGDDFKMINLENPYVSRRHCILKCIPGSTESEIEFTITDLGSTNKTYLNERVLSPDEEFYLRDGDIIKIGLIQLKYREVNI